jgi:uncharacterized Rmd1/YagE family protein
MATCNAYCTANIYFFSELKNFLENNHKTVAFKDTLYIKKNLGEAFIFQFGVLVLWGLGYDESQLLLSELKKFSEGPLSEPISEELTYTEENNTVSIHEDHIYLSKTDNDVLEKLAISHGIAQSLKLAQFELSVQKTIESTKHIPENIATVGSPKMNRITIAKTRGELYLVNSYITLQFDLLDTPEFFWEYPEIEPIYEMTANYLEIKPRIEILDKKLQVIHELFTMLADEQNHKHSSSLEWIIIWLIAIEILMFITHDILELF